MRDRDESLTSFPNKAHKTIQNSEMNFRFKYKLHFFRDLAARNCLVDNLRVKITDFGMSREEDVYMSESKNFPVRWTAPESLTNSKHFIYVPLDSNHRLSLVYICT